MEISTFKLYAENLYKDKVKVNNGSKKGVNNYPNQCSKIFDHNNFEDQQTMNEFWLYMIQNIDNVDEFYPWIQEKSKDQYSPLTQETRLQCFLDIIESNEQVRVEIVQHNGQEFHDDLIIKIKKQIAVFHEQYNKLRRDKENAAKKILSDQLLYTDEDCESDQSKIEESDNQQQLGDSNKKSIKVINDVPKLENDILRDALNVIKQELNKKDDMIQSLQSELNTKSNVMKQELQKKDEIIQSLRSELDSIKSQRLQLYDELLLKALQKMVGIDKNK